MVLRITRLFIVNTYLNRTSFSRIYMLFFYALVSLIQKAGFFICNLFAFLSPFVSVCVQPSRIQSRNFTSVWLGSKRRLSSKMGVVGHMSNE